MDDAQHDTRATETDHGARSDTASAAPVARLLANPRRVRRA